MNTETETLINVIRDRMERMTDDERLNLLSDLFDGYCKHCGGSYSPCYCLGDY